MLSKGDPVTVNDILKLNILVLEKHLLV